MAAARTVPNPQPPEDDAVPGSTIDDLLSAGDIPGARAEFERLCLEGLEGEPVAMTPEAWEHFRQDLHRKAKLAS